MSLADDLAAFVDAIGLGAVHVVGWSYGATVALAMELLHPGRARSLFLYEPGRINDAIISDPETQRLLATERQGTAPAASAVRSGDVTEAAKRFIEWVDGRETGEFETVVPARLGGIIIDNARTLPVMLAAPPPSVDKEAFSNQSVPAAIVLGQQTRIGGA